MIALTIVFGLLILAGMFGAGMLFGYQRGLSHHVCEPQVFVAPAPASRQLQLSREQVRVRDNLIAMLSTVQVVPASPYTILPWQRVPSPARTFWVQELVNDLQDLRAEVVGLVTENTRLSQLVRNKDRLRRRHLATIRRMRLSMVPVVEHEAVEDLRARSLTVAKSASTRAAELSNTLTELDAARMEAMDLSDFNAHVEHIFDRIGTAPNRTLVTFAGA